MTSDAAAEAPGRFEAPLHEDPLDKQEAHMVDVLRKLLLAGLGTIDLTEEKAKALFNDLVARGEITEKDARDLFSGWAARASEQRARFQSDIEQAVSRALTAMGLVRRADLDALAARVVDLEARLAARTTAPDQTAH